MREGEIMGPLQSLNVITANVKLEDPLSLLTYPCKGWIVYLHFRWGGGSAELEMAAVG